jgi:vitamin B12 transporter
MFNFKFPSFLFVILTSNLLLQSATGKERISNEIIQITGSRLNDNNQGSVSSLNRQQIEVINPYSTLDLLHRMPFVAVTESSLGGVSYISIRGGEPNFTLIMIDGIIVNDTTNARGGGFDFSQINPAAIERIEVYRGGISAIYGGDAISGAIHILTRNEARDEVSLELGTQQHLKVSGTFSKAINNELSFLTSVSSNQRKKSALAQQDNKQALFKVNYENNGQQHQGIATYSETKNSGFAEDSGGEFFASPYTVEHRNSKQWLLGLSSFFSLTDLLKLQMKASWVQHEEASQHPGINDGVLSGIPASDIVSQIQRTQAEAYIDYILHSTTNLIAGVSYSNANGTNDGTLDFGFLLPVDFELNQEIFSAFSEIQYRRNQFSLSAGWRFDEASKYNSETSVRLATTYSVNDTVKIFSVYNEGYKLPSFFALAHPLVGNPNLQPERSENKEIGISYAGVNTQITIITFENKFSDLVDFDADLFTNVNRNAVTVTGIEFDIKTQLYKWLGAGFNTSYMDTQAYVTLRRRPNWFGSMSLQGSWDRLNILLAIDSRSHYSDSSVPTGQINLAGNAKASIAANWQYSDHILLSVNMDNVLGRHYQDSVGFVFDESIVKAGLQYRF